jgi:toxin ParE1/3/4
MRRRLVYSRSAEIDLVAIFDFIAHDNPRRAASYVEEIRQACRNLCDTPHLGIERSDLRSGIRTLSLWRQIIVAYALPPGRVQILRIVSGRRDYRLIIGRPRSPRR